ncbi:hypothetical protein J6590_072368 [Homalodisca vitripennis]|nr:hypothetical protein J6590_072368 [Homalodisca vitripennis]
MACHLRKFQLPARGLINKPPLHSKQSAAGPTTDDFFIRQPPNTAHKLKEDCSILNHLLNTLKPTILVLTDHGLNTSKMQNANINGYLLMADYSRECHKLGEVAIYAQETTNKGISALDISAHCVELTCEAALIKLSLKGHTLHLLGVYRSPGGQAKQAIEVISNTY